MKNDNMPKEKTSKKKSNKSKLDIPQLYIEDTFDVSGDNSKQTELIEIETPVNIVEKMFISEEDLLNLSSFKANVDKLIIHIFYEKSFNHLLDFLYLTGMYKHYEIDDLYDEVYYLIKQVIFNYRQRLSKISLDYATYQRIMQFFDDIPVLYVEFKNSTSLDKVDLKEKMDAMINMEKFMKINFFSYLK